MFPDESEVRILTGRVRHGAQARALRGMGIEHVGPADGGFPRLSFCGINRLLPVVEGIFEARAVAPMAALSCRASTARPRGRKCRLPPTSGDICQRFAPGSRRGGLSSGHRFFQVLVFPICKILDTRSGGSGITPWRARNETRRTGACQNDGASCTGPIHSKSQIRSTAGNKPSVFYLASEALPQTDKA